MRAGVDVDQFLAHRTGQAKHLDGCTFRFYPFYEEDPKATEEAGRPIHRDADWIEIINFAGEKTPRKVQDQDKLAYPEYWAAYAATKLPPTNGTWLAEWCLITPAKLAEFQHFGWRTIEELAAIPEEVTKEFPALIEWQRKASNWLAAADSKQSEVTKLREQVHRAQTALASLQDQYNGALKRIDSLEGTQFAV